MKTEISAQDLRIGNLVKINAGANITICGIDDTFVTFRDGLGTCLYEDIHGIPLTPEILEKAGFSKYNNSKDMFIDPTQEYVFDMDRKWLLKFSEAYGELTYVSFVVIDQVHKLQNLYWALVGQELKIEL